MIKLSADNYRRKAANRAVHPCACLLLLFGSKPYSQAGIDGRMVQVPAARIEYSVPGYWDAIGEKPMDSNRTCFPQLRRHDQDEVVSVLLPPALVKQTLESIATKYASTVKKVPGVRECTVVNFVSERQIKGFNIRYKGTAPQTSDPATMITSVYLFINRKGETVFVQYIADSALFEKEVDDSIRKTLNCPAEETHVKAPSA